MEINKVLISEKLEKFLIDRGILKQYLKATKYLKAKFYLNIDFKLRQPKEKKIYSFRINKQYRAFGYIKDDIFYVFEINDHQNY